MSEPADACTVRGSCQLSRDLAKPGGGWESQPVAIYALAIRDTLSAKVLQQRGGSGDINYLPGAWKTSAPAFPAAGTASSSAVVYPPCLFGNVESFKGQALQQLVLFGRVEVLGFRWMHGGQVWEGLLMLCSQVAQSIEH